MSIAQFRAIRGVGKLWGVFNRAKLSLFSTAKMEIAAGELVHFQRMVRRYIQSKQKGSFLAKRRQGKWVPAKTVLYI